MNQLEMNNRVAEVYGVDAFRNCLADKASTDKYNSHIIAIPLHQDTLTLFRLCVGHNFDLRCNEKSKVIVGWNNKGFFRTSVEDKDYSTKEAATCAVMFSALCKLKGITNE